MTGDMFRRVEEHKAFVEQFNLVAFGDMSPVAVQSFKMDTTGM